MQLIDYDRARTIMRRSELDVIVAHTKVHRGYIADHHRFFPILDHTQLTWYSTGNTPLPSYVSFAGLPMEESRGAFLICREGNERRGAEKAGIWLPDLRFWEIDPAATLAETLADKGLDRARIGIELDNMPLWLYERLQHSLPYATFREATNALAEMRQVKTPEEIRRLRVAAEATERAHEAVWSGAREGLTYDEVELIIHETLAHEGVDCNMAGISFSARIATRPQPPLARGQAIRTDIGAEYLGYLSDVSRVSFLGEPDAVHREVYETIRVATEMTLARVRAGAKVAEILAPGTEVARQIGGHAFLHGVGRVIMEPRLTDELVAGEVLCVEAEVNHALAGIIAIEDEVVVTETGCEFLTAHGRELRILG